MARKYSQLENDDEVVVVFDREQPVYTGGEVISGRVLLNVNPSSEVRGLTLKIRGKATVVITKTEPGGAGAQPQTYTFRSKKYFVKEEQTLSGALAAGDHEFPFSFTLPEQCPPTFAWGGDLGRVVYYVKACVDEKKSLRKKLAHMGASAHNKLKRGRYGVWIVVPSVTVPQWSEPVEASKKTKAGGLFGLVGGKPIYCSVQLDGGSALRFGTTAAVRVTVDNQSGSRVNTIRASLVHTLTFSAANAVEVRTITLAKTKMTDGLPIRKRSEVRGAILELQMPHALPHCRPESTSGRVEPVPRSVFNRLAKEKPLHYVWPYAHHASPSLDPQEKWLVEPNIQSEYAVVVKFSVKNGSNAVAKVPVTLHPGPSMSFTLGDHEGDSDASDTALAASVDGLNDKR